MSLTGVTRTSPYPSRVMDAKPISAPKGGAKSPGFFFATDVPKVKSASSALAKAMASGEKVAKIRSKKI